MDNTLDLSDNAEVEAYPALGWWGESTPVHFVVPGAPQDPSRMRHNEAHWVLKQLDIDIEQTLRNCRPIKFEPIKQKCEKSLELGAKRSSPAIASQDSPMLNRPSRTLLAVIGKFRLSSRTYVKSAIWSSTWWILVRLHTEQKQWRNFFSHLLTLYIETAKSCSVAEN